MKTTIATISYLILSFGFSLQNVNANELRFSSTSVFGTDDRSCYQASGQLGDKIRLDCKSRGGRVIDIGVGQCKWFGVNTFVSANYICSEDSQYVKRVDKKKEAEEKRKNEEAAKKEQAQLDAKIEAIIKDVHIGDDVVVNLATGVFEATLLKINRNGTSVLKFAEDDIAIYETDLVTRRKITTGDRANICHKGVVNIPNRDATIVKIDGSDVFYTVKVASGEDSIVLRGKLIDIYESHFNNGKCN